ncbi:MAG: hypothetical protein CMK52_02320 [Proteobacteria bacterium]|nr:hypothetical protein [Pseudomonadota bacterium]
MTKFVFVVVCFIYACMVGIAEANTTETFTYSGAESESSPDGFIPNYHESRKEYKELISRSHQSGRKVSIDSERPIFIINKKNVGGYSHYLSLGLRTIVEKYPNFEIQVFSSYRSSNHPRRIKLQIEGSLENFHHPNKLRKYIPFKFPKNGAEVMLNHLSRYQGESEEKKVHSFVVNSKGVFTKVGVWSKRLSPKVLDKGVNEMQYYVLARYFEPASLVGDILLVHEPIPILKKKRKAWIYSSAQRRVRRAPDASHDATGRGSQGLITADQIDGFNGDLDRFDWKLRGKETLLVPYNVNKLDNKNIKYSDILGKNCIKAEFVRYEFHRVWVVEARLKQSSRHIYSKRVFYVDEDSWMVLMEDAYSTRGDLWRVALHGLVQQKAENFPWYRVHAYHDLNNEMCFVSGLDNEVVSRPRFGFKDKVRNYTPDALRRINLR